MSSRRVAHFKYVLAYKVETRLQFMQCAVSLNLTKLMPFINASNAFNALNRSAALHNIRVLCPIVAAYTVNTYRQPARLFVIGGQELRSVEGTTQGDPLVTSLYAISLQPLITKLQLSLKCDQTVLVRGWRSRKWITWWRQMLVGGSFRKWTSTRILS